MKSAEEQYFEKMSREGERMRRRKSYGGCLGNILGLVIGIPISLFGLWVSLQILGYIGVYP